MVDLNPDMKAARAAIAKKYGDEALAQVGGQTVKLPALSTGSIMLDLALGVGGFPRGRLIELYGPPSSGKSTLSLACARNCQALDLPVLYCDYECAFDPEYAGIIGVNTDDPNLWILSQPENMEEGLGIAEEFIERSLVGLVIFDSLAAMVPKKILEGEIGDSHVAVQARLMSVALQRLTSKIKRSQAVVLFINHIRESIPMGGSRVVRKTTPGGSALKFYSSVRVELSPAESIKGRFADPVSGKGIEGPVALKVRALCVKNKVAAPYRDGFFYLYGGAGINEARSVVDVGIARGVIAQNGSRFILPFRANAGSDKKLNLGGMPAVLQHLKENPKRYDKLREVVLAAVMGKPKEEPKVVAEDVNKPGTARDVPIEAETSVVD